MSSNTIMVKLSLFDTLLGLIPLALAIVIYAIHLRKTRDFLLASSRMVLQLILIGYALAFIFEYEITLIGLTLLTLMLSAAAMIAIRPLTPSRNNYLAAWCALFIAGTFNLAWIVFAVLNLSPWYQPEIVIPLAGMVFANGMNAISQAGERYESVIKKSHAEQAEYEGFNAAMIPQINALVAVGLASLPGVMTGQILSGVSPLIAVRYQIIIMSMVASMSVISVWSYFRIVRFLTARNDKSRSFND